jgi:hypothetical protein
LIQKRHLDERALGTLRRAQLEMQTRHIDAARL